MKNGKGDLYMNDGSTISGTFLNNFLEGKATCRFKNKEVYEGEFKASKKNGEGIYYYPNGNSYKGTYFEDMRHGWGTLSFQNGGSLAG